MLMKMFKAMSLSVVCAVCLASVSAYAVTIEPTLEYASIYLWRGITANERPALQLSLYAYDILDEEAEMGALTLGVWADWALGASHKTYMYNGYYYTDRRQFGEVDLEVEYELPTIIDDLTIALGYSAYLYTDSEDKTDHELHFVTSYDTFLQPTVGLHYTVAGGEYTKKQWFLECGVSHEFDIGDELEIRDGLTFTVGADIGIWWWNSKMKEDWEDEDEDGDLISGSGLRSGFAYAKYYAEGTWGIAALDDLSLSAKVEYYQRMRKDTLGSLFRNKWVAIVGLSKEF